MTSALKSFLLWSLPSPVVFCILEQVVKSSTTAEALQLRQICKFFDKQVSRMVFGQELIDLTKLRQWETPIKAISRYLLEKVRLGRSTNTFIQTLISIVDYCPNTSLRDVNDHRYLCARVVCDTAAIAFSQKQMRNSEIMEDIMSNPNLAFTSGTKGISLPLAAALGDEERVLAFLEGGVDPNTFHPLFGCGISAAAYQGHTRVIEVLISKGADPIYPYWVNWSHFDAGGEMDDLDWETSQALTRLAFAASAGHVNSLEFMLSCIPDAVDNLNFHFRYAVAQAIRGHRYNVFAMLLPMLEQFPTIGGGSPTAKAFVLAATVRADKIVSLLPKSIARHDCLDCIIKRCCTCEFISRAIILATKNKRDSSLELIFQAGYHPNVYNREFRGTASEHVCSPSTLQLLQRYRGNIESKIPHLLFSSVCMKDISRLRYFLRWKPNLTVVDMEKAMCQAASYGLNPFVERLLHHGASVNGIPGSNDSIPLLCAHRNGKDEMVRILIDKYGADDVRAMDDKR